MADDDCVVLANLFPTVFTFASAFTGCCTLKTVVCDSSRTKITQLLLDNEQLTGAIPRDVVNFTALDTLKLGDNALTGTIPVELASMKTLKHLGLGNNRLTGTIPPELGDLTDLVHLNISYNQLTGEVPTTLAKLLNLEYLSIGENKLTGTLPVQLADLTRLTFLDFQPNLMTGIIPPEYGRLTNLRGLFLAGNGFTGGVPPELGNLENLEKLHLFSNKLSGSIPPELSKPLRYADFLIHDNAFYGDVPEFIYRIGLYTLVWRSGDNTNSTMFRTASMGTVLDKERSIPPPLKTLTTCQSILGSSWPTIRPTDLPSPINPTAPNPSRSSTPSSSNNSNNTLLLSAAIGGPLLLCLIIGIIIGVVVTRRRRRRAEEDEKSNATSHGLPRVDPNNIPFASTVDVRNESSTRPGYVDVHYTVREGGVDVHHLSYLRTTPSAPATSVLRLPDPNSVEIDKEKLRGRGTLFSGISSTTSGGPPSGFASKGRYKERQPMIELENGDKTVPKNLGISSVAGWQKEDVIAWLLASGISPLIIDVFEDHDVSGYMLLLLTDQKLIEMGVGSSTARNVILHAIDDLRGRENGSKRPRSELPPQYS
ncbi:hypothetical protein HDU67_002336 [Dinochytrium kinnereticum]|nr:hypothetical protein HDU67_002336 [Dinochytrium kinnereticum]